MGGKLRVSFKRVLFGEMEDAKCIPEGLRNQRGGRKGEKS